MPPSIDLQRDVLPIQLPMQPINLSRRRASRTEANGPFPSGTNEVNSKVSSLDGASEVAFTSSPLAWLSRVITKAGRDERRNASHSSTTLPLKKQLFSKATVVTLEKKYATVSWADPSFRWSAPEIHTTHFTILLSVMTALASTLYHATLFKIFSSIDACLATVMFYLNTIQLLKSLPAPYALMLPDLVSSIVHSHYTPYILTTAMITIFIISWKKTAMLSLLLMVLMIPGAIWGFVAHESWLGLAFGLVGLSMFAADRFKLFCGHSYWHLTGGLSLWYGIASGALAK
ncbi:hypothetical protein BGZ76_002172 [Entomortierella beljakovae]|nr:hypothetical protein BGZ76_002172 [Entomortierella beljakovae]